MSLDPVQHEQAPIASVEEMIEEARQGRMSILVDDEDRENEGDIILPAQFVTAEAINFMIRHARGIICLAMAPDLVDRLQLPMMVQDNGSHFHTPFTISIEARTGVTSGVSAADRAHTILTAIHKGPQDIVSPGHMFPLRAQTNGVLDRMGHTEGSVDLAKLAGLTQASVICEITNDDGTMARMPDLIRFAEKHEMKIGTIADLIAHRKQKNL